MVNILVTGGAGFIGSHLVDALIRKGENVVVIDNLSSGTMKNLEQHENNPKFRFVKGDLLNQRDIERVMNRIDTVYHLAANPDVRVGITDTKNIFDQNIVATYNVLEAMKKSGVKNIAYTSTSTVYGDAKILPTPEDYGPLVTISLYAASKLSSESLISSYCYTFDMKGVVFRLANVIGTRSNHGISYDFAQKLKKNPKKLEILGDGSQQKSYLYVDDCVDGIILGSENINGPFEVFNLGSDDRITVKEIARIAVDKFGLKNVKLEFGGGTIDGRGWKGDVKFMLLSNDRIKKLGWKAKYNSKESIEKTMESLKYLFF